MKLSFGEKRYYDKDASTLNSHELKGLFNCLRGSLLRHDSTCSATNSVLTKNAPIVETSPHYV